MVKQRAADAVAQIAAALDDLGEIMADPAQVPFDEVVEAFEQLEKVINGKSMMDAAFAWLADRSGAGRRVGSVRTMDYLTRRLGLSKSQAMARLKAGESLFTPPEPPPPPPPPDPEETAAQRQEREAEERRQQEEIERRRGEQQQARDRAARVPAEKLKIIEDELRDLNEGAQASREEIYLQAMVEAGYRTPEDLRTWLRYRVAKANRSGAKDLTAAHRKRFLQLGTPDSDGGRRITGYLGGAEAEQLEAALSLGDRAGSNLPEGVTEEQDTRTRAQRRADQLINLVAGRLVQNQATARHGVGSVLVSMTAEDVESLDEHSTFTTNTGGELNIYDLVRLGAAKFDVMVLHDEQGQPLALGRGRRTASFYQRIAMLAAQSVCGCFDCTTAGVHLEAHHLIPWEQGGPTDVGNMVLVCLPHHSDNDDTRTGAGGKGWFVRCPVSGRVGWRAGPGEPLVFNETQAQQRSNGARIRDRDPDQPPRDDSPTQPGLFDAA